VRISTPLLQMAVMCLLFAASACADEWVVDRSVSTRVTHNDNILMRSTDALGDTSLALTPALTLTNRSETREAGVNLAPTVNRYVQHSEYDTVDYRANVNLKWASELDKRSLTLARVRDSTLTTELATTGVVLARRQRTLTNAQATWQHSLTENTSANAALSLASVRYEAAPGLTDYDDNSLTAGVLHGVSERSSVGASLFTRDYQTTDGNVKSRINGASLNGEMKYSERLVLSLEAGRNRTRTDLQLAALICPSGSIRLTTLLCGDLATLTLVPVNANKVPVSSETKGSTFSGAASYQLESGSLSATIARSLNPSGGGTLLRSDQLGLNYQRRFSETLDFGFSANMVRSSVLGNAASESRYTRLAPTLQWQIDQWISMSFGYALATQTATGQLQPARSNMVFVGLNYGFRPLSVSR
jgi:hypothetical protein